MEKQDEKPHGLLKACVQVSGASFLLGDQSLLPLCPTVWSSGHGRLSGSLCHVLGLLVPPSQQASNTFYTFYGAPYTSSPF